MEFLEKSRYWTFPTSLGDPSIEGALCSWQATRWSSWRFGNPTNIESPCKVTCVPCIQIVWKMTWKDCYFKNWFYVLVKGLPTLMKKRKRCAPRRWRRYLSVSPLKVLGTFAVPPMSYPRYSDIWEYDAVYMQLMQCPHKSTALAFNMCKTPTLISSAISNDLNSSEQSTKGFWCLACGRKYMDSSTK